jgi:hypothetical protein
MRRPDPIVLRRVPGRESLHNLCQKEIPRPFLQMASICLFAQRSSSRFEFLIMEAEVGKDWDCFLRCELRSVACSE